MGGALGREGHATGADVGLDAVDQDEDLALEDVDGLVGLGMAVQRRALALRHLVLEEEEGAASVLGEELPRVEATSCEGLLVAFTCGSDDRGGSGHAASPALVCGTHVP